MTSTSSQNNKVSINNEFTLPKPTLCKPLNKRRQPPTKIQAPNTPKIVGPKPYSKYPTHRRNFSAQNTMMR